MKPKAFLHWISSEDAVTCETRIYGSLFTVECIDKDSIIEKGHLVWNMTVGLPARMKK